MVGPRLDRNALAAVRHRASHVQIIASAGSGKTEVMAQPVADLLVLDDKTSTRQRTEHGLQLQRYTDAVGRKGLDVRGATSTTSGPAREPMST